MFHRYSDIVFEGLNMDVMAYVIRDSSTRLWGLSANERLKRQIRQVGGVTFAESTSLPEQAPAGVNAKSADTQLLLIDANFLFEPRTLSGLLERPNSLLYLGEQPAAAFVESGHMPAMSELFAAGDEDAIPAGVQKITPADLGAYDDRLRRSTAPLLELVDENHRQQLESKLYGNSYKGITDLVTKWAWPRPARQGVRFCANLGITPNMVTSVGLLLVVAACYLFLHGYYAAGLLCGWIMTFLDTVDGKLARVTIQSSPFGHYFDHGIDLIHPPFWYYFWSQSLANFEPVFGLTEAGLVNWIIVGYIAGRLVEVLFHLLGSCGVFTWRPFDAWIRLITARRNPCLIILTLSVMLGNPAWGLVGVFIWTVLSSLQLVLRLLQGVFVRLSNGRLTSWMADEHVQQKHAYSYGVFAGTRAAYREVDS